MTTLFQQFRLKTCSSITLSFICYKFHYSIGNIFAFSPRFLFTRKTSRCFSFALVIISLTQFLPNAQTDFHEIFRDGRYQSGVDNLEPDFYTSLPVRKMADFLFSCPPFFSETKRGRATKFSGINNLTQLMCTMGLNISAVNTGRHRKCYKKSNLQIIVLNSLLIPAYLGILRSVGNSLFR